MDDINRQHLFPLWGSSILDYKIDLVSNSIHFKLYYEDSERETSATKGIWTQIDIYNVRMFCYTHNTCYNREGDPQSGSFSHQEECYPESFLGPVDVPDHMFDEGFPEFLKEHVRAGKNILMEEIQATEPGEANVKVSFKFKCALFEVPSPYYNADQNIVIDFTDSALTISAKKIVINGNCFIWNQEAGTFLREEGEGTVPSKKPPQAALFNS